MAQAEPRQDVAAKPEPAQELESKISAIGAGLASSLTKVIAEIPGNPKGPQALATALGLDKVLTSRLLKASGAGDPIAVAHHAPGPEPIRRLLRAAQKKGVDAKLISDAMEAVDGFERLIRDDLGDRTALDAIISAWLPEARRDFELRRKQSAFKAISQLKGVHTQINFGGVILHPNEDGETIDVVWLIGFLGLQRLRPGAGVKFTTRRFVKDQQQRRPTNLEGEPVDSLADARLDEFCDAPPAPIEARRSGDVVHYMLAGDRFGPGSEADLVVAEVNRAELPRAVPKGSNRKSYYFAEATPPTRRLVFDVLVHRDLYAGSDPALAIYDTAHDGVADVNDRARDVDRLDLAETIQHLGNGPENLRITGVPGYVSLVRRSLDALSWNGRDFRSYRVDSAYPLYGSQITMIFDPPTR